MSVSEQKEASEQFFREVLVEDALRQALAFHHLDVIEVGPSQHNSVLWISRRKWLLAALENEPKGLYIHFEARRRDELRLDIGLEPYEGNIENKPALFRQLTGTLARKTRIINELRSRVSSAGLLPSIQVSTKHLPTAESTNSHTILKFKCQLTEDPSPRQSAEFFARVINHVAPTVDSMVDEETRGHAIQWVV
jgi:hypothetical protein